MKNIVFLTALEVLNLKKNKKRLFFSSDFATEKHMFFWCYPCVEAGSRYLNIWTSLLTESQIADSVR